MASEADLGSEGEAPGGPAIRWPPPGLERLQGDLAHVAGRAALSGVILVMPLLFVLGPAQGYSLGPFGEAWWVSQVLAIVGLAFALDALVRLVVMMRRASNALEQGYGFATVANVLADRGRDMGFLLTGARHFSLMDARERDTIRAIRLSAVSLYALAGIWLPNALAVGVVMAARGVVSPDGLWMLTLLPAMALYVVGALAGIMGDFRVRRARRKWYQQPWAEDLASEEAQGWREASSTTPGIQVGASVGQPSPRLLRTSAILLVVLAVVVFVPVLTLVPTAAIGPIMAAITTPNFNSAARRAASAEALRPYVVAVDPSVTPAEAGQLLHDLAHVGSTQALSPGEREPLRRIAQPWLPEAANPMGVEPTAWKDSIFPIVVRGVTPEQRAYLEGLASHPAHADLSRLASAGAIDIASARYENPLPEGVTLATLPFPQRQFLAAGIQAHFGAAALELLNGRTARAQEMIAEVISVGFLLGDGGPILFDNLSGFAFVDDGGRALMTFFDVTGRTADATTLGNLRGAAERASARAQLEDLQGTEAWFRSLPLMIGDTSVVRGMRWEFLVGWTTLTPCLNVHRMVFGPDQEYGDILSRARESLVAWPSEEPLFELARRGWFGAADDADETWLGRLLSVSMRGGEGSCGDIVRRIGGPELPL